jgi:hypothetical protein
MNTIRDIFAVIGGAGVLIIGLSKFFGNILGELFKESNRKKTEIQLETIRQDLGLQRVRADRYAISQYDIYVELWKNLQELRTAIDSLWQEVTNQNIEILTDCFRKTKIKIMEWSLFFDETHLNKLNKLLDIIEQYNSGKIGMQLDFRNIEYLVSQNKKYKNEFENLMKEIREDFRDRLSTIKIPKFT